MPLVSRQKASKLDMRSVVYYALIYIVYYNMPPMHALFSRNMLEDVMSTNIQESNNPAHHMLWYER